MAFSNVIFVYNRNYLISSWLIVETYLKTDKHKPPKTFKEKAKSVFEEWIDSFTGHGLTNV
jgi:hypothetical protein